MAPGTKILLAVLALIAVGIFAYYAAIPQGERPATPDPSTEETAAPDSSQADLPATEESQTETAPSAPPVEQPTRVNESPTSGQPPLGNLPAGGSGSEGGLADSVRRALAADNAEAGDKPLSSGPIESAAEPEASPPRQPAGEGPAEEPAKPPSTPEEKPPAATEGQEQPPRPPARPPEPLYTEYQVKAGDTLSSIAGNWFGDPNKWDLIYRANPRIDPDNLDIGQKLRLPPKTATRQAIRPQGTGVHVVGSGETLSGIAKAYYGDAGKWRLIYEANERTIGPDPDELTVGMKLTIPPEPKPAEDDKTGP